MHICIAYYAHKNQTELIMSDNIIAYANNFSVYTVTKAHDNGVIEAVDSHTGGQIIVSECTLLTFANKQEDGTYISKEKAHIKEIKEVVGELPNAIVKFKNHLGATQLMHYTQFNERYDLPTGVKMKFFLAKKQQENN